MKTVIIGLLTVISFYSISAQQKIEILDLKPHELELRLRGLDFASCDSLTLQGSIDPQELYFFISKKFTRMKYLDAKRLEFVKCDSFPEMYPTRYLFPSVFSKHPSLQTVLLPDSVKVIDKNAFSQCEKLSTVVFPKGIEQILEGAFLGCTQLAVSIPPTVFNLGDGCFSKCKIPDSLILPDSLCFYSSIKVSDSYVISEKNRRFTVESGVLYSKDKSILYSVPTSKKSYEIPPTVRHIAPYAFSGNSLSKITIPDSIRMIWSGAFAGSQYLTEIVLPNNPDIKLGTSILGGSAKSIAVMCLSPYPYQNWKSAFYFIPKGTAFYVPKGSLDNYKRAPWANQFRIEETWVKESQNETLSD